jgi:RimJ/RimL family protein N-acetyltransferase
MPRPPEAARQDMALEPLGPQHAAALYEVLADPTLYRFVDYGPPPSAQHLRDVYTRLARGAPEGSGQVWINWAILEAGKPAGYVQATVVPAKGEAWLAYVLGARYQGRGHATRACEALMNHVGAARWLATVEHDNAASIALLGRLGFRAASGEETSGRDLTPTERLYVR